MTLGAVYPVRVEATLDPGLNRWLWLAKWLLAIPHYFVLAFLWLAFAVVSVMAFFAILVSGRYPPGLFDFNVGVLRWTWRVAYYSYGALGTDRYPPFTLDEVPDYPTHLEVAYPTHLSRGLVLVKWWLLAIPHYVVVAIFAGGVWAAWQTDHNAAPWGSGLIGLLVLVSAIVLAVTGRYPQGLFDFVLGLNRWVLRVAAYASLMTDEYPPFRLDLGGHEPGGTITVPRPPEGPQGEPSAVGTGVQEETTGAAGRGAGEPGSGGAGPSARWTAGRVVTLVVGCIAGLAALGLLAGGGVTTWLNSSQRDAAGYVTTGTRAFATSGYALTSDEIDLGSSEVTAPADLLGTVRIRATATDPTKPVFVGIGARSVVDGYLAGVRHAVVTGWLTTSPRYNAQAGGAPSAPPTDVHIWAVSAAGPGTQVVTWKPSTGSWTVVVMSPDASPGVSVTADAGATIPDLGWIAAGFFVAGGLVLAVAVLLVVLPATRASRRPTAPPAP